MSNRKKNVWPTSVVVITFALHAKGREFEPHVDQFFSFFVIVITNILTLYRPPIPSNNLLSFPPGRYVTLGARASVFAMSRAAYTS